MGRPFCRQKLCFRPRSSDFSRGQAHYLITWNPELVASDLLNTQFTEDSVQVLSLFRDKGKSTQHLTSLASTRIAQKILKLHSRCSVPSRNVPNTAITPLQRETRKRKRSEKSHLQKLCQQLEEVVGGWITTQTNLLVPPPSMDLEDHSHSKSCSTQNLMHLYYPSGRRINLKCRPRTVPTNWYCLKFLPSLPPFLHHSLLHDWIVVYSFHIHLQEPCQSCQSFQSRHKNPWSTTLGFWCQL